VTRPRGSFVDWEQEAADQLAPSARRMPVTPTTRRSSGCRRDLRANPAAVEWWGGTTPTVAWPYWADPLRQRVGRPARQLSQVVDEPDIRVISYFADADDTRRSSRLLTLLGRVPLTGSFALGLPTPARHRTSFARAELSWAGGAAAGKLKMLRVISRPMTVPAASTNDIVTCSTMPASRSAA
jgi:hypothetical protein